ncbi:MAG: rRNA pseudouridine synthase [Deltaproteobacteria bacterium]|nr:rRNA pseudouridine synthase [Deltaproteobacteria bacterium]
MERLQKIIARAGLASRREAERWIQEGRVTVNGKAVTELGVRADPNKDKIKVNGKLLSLPANVYFLFHKPPAMITSMGDPEGRPNVGAWLEDLGVRARVFPVGRLDYNSSGLLILTSDGELAQRLMHPRHGVSKRYHVKLSRWPSERDLERLRQGIHLEDGRTAPARVKVLRHLRKNAWVEIEIHEGKNREIRRMFEALGCFVEKLMRVRLGPIELGALAPGEYRPLSRDEIVALKKAVGM